MTNRTSQELYAAGQRQARIEIADDLRILHPDRGRIVVDSAYLLGYWEALTQYVWGQLATVTLEAAEAKRGEWRKLRASPGDTPVKEQVIARYTLMLAEKLEDDFDAYVDVQTSGDLIHAMVAPPKWVIPVFRKTSWWKEGQR